MLVKQTHIKDWRAVNKQTGMKNNRDTNEMELRYTDSRLDEQNRGLSIKASPMSLVLPDLREKHYLINIMDCPGHVNFSDEMAAALRLVDGCVVVVDVAEGVLLNTERSIKYAVLHGIPMTLVINKIDRLILELKLPPKDAYLKIINTISDVNAILVECLGSGTKRSNDENKQQTDEKSNDRKQNNIGLNKWSGLENQQLFSPILGNVCFASSMFDWCFTLESFAKLYCDFHGSAFDYKRFAKKLFGDWYFHSKDRKFRRFAETLVMKQSEASLNDSGGNSHNVTQTRNKRTFVEFILEPLYKIYSHVLGNDATRLGKLLSELGTGKLKKYELELDSKPLLQLILSRFFGKSGGFVEMCVNHIPSPILGNVGKVRRNYTGDLAVDVSLFYATKSNSFEKRQNKQERMKRIAKLGLENEFKYCNELHFGMLDCDSSTSAAIVNITKMYARPDATEFDGFGRVFCGTVRVGDRVRVLREGYSLDDREDMSVVTISKIWIYQSRYRIEVNRVTAGNWALFGGLDSAVTKTATLVHDTPSAATTKNNNKHKRNKKKNKGKNNNNNKESSVEFEHLIDNVTIFKPLQFDTIAVIKVAIEPIKPSELPKMTHGLRCINKSYPLCVTKVEESGEHVIVGTGELYMDCLLHDLRSMFSEIEIKVADPIVTFCETCKEASKMQAFDYSTNHKNKISMICEPLNNEIVDDIEKNLNGLSLHWSPKQLGNYFESHYGWDKLQGRNIWSFGANSMNQALSVQHQPQQPYSRLFGINDNTLGSGSHTMGSIIKNPNILINDTLPSQISKEKLNRNCRHSIIQGFQWAAREGPLCDEPMRNCLFKLMSGEISDNMIECGGGQMIPLTRKVVYSSFMLAEPALMEPIMFVEAICPPDCVKAVEDVVSHRRGRLLTESPKAGTPFVVLNAELPAIDSFGFETDLRSHTQGQAFCLQTFSRWDFVPGDPMDDTITLLPLEPQPAQKLAREFMLKTRKRKGLSENVSFNKYFGSEMNLAYAELAIC